MSEAYREQNATDIALHARKLDASGAYNQAQCEMYRALRFLNARKETDIRITFVGRGVNRWIVELANHTLLRTPVFADVCDLIVTLDGDA